MNKIQEVKMSKFLSKYISLILIVLFGLSDLKGQEDLSLSLAIEKALESNYGIIISKANEEIAGVNNNWGTAGRYPTIGFTANSANSFELIDPTSTTMRVNGGLGLNWTIFNGFKVNITKGKLEKLEELAKGRSAVVIESTIQDVVMSYYNILLQKERLVVLEKVMLLSKDRYDYELVKHDIGSTVTYNVLQAKNLYLNDKASYLNQEVIVRNAVRNINFLLGADANTEWEVTDMFQADSSDYILSDLMDKMMASNQTLQNQYVNLLLQKEEISLQKSSLYPRLSIAAGMNGGYTHFDQSGLPLNTSESVSPYGNLSLSWDIYTGGNRQRAIQIAKINEEITQVETNEIKHSLNNQLLNEFDLYNLRKTLLNVATESLEAAELNLQIADEKFKSGAINSFNYRDIQQSFLYSALQQLQAKYDLIYSKTNLTRLTGGFLNQEE